MDADATAVTPHGVEARAVEAGRGLAWWSEAWALFMRSALLWVALALIVVVGFGVIGFVPLLGSIASALLLPAVAAGWLIAARKVEAGGVLEVADLLAGFQGERLTPLLVLGALLAGASVLMFGLTFMLGAGAVWSVMSGGMRHGGMGGVMPAMGMGLVALGVFLVFGLLATAALWFAPALVVFRQLAPIDAIKASFAAVLKNVLPFLLYGVIQIALAIVASIPFGLGWFVLLPVMMLTAYTSYRDVFGG
jgi:uncharacterized membrane protein